jgi:hypothetical protein
MALNKDFETDFEIDDPSKAVLQIQNRGLPNREKITADEIGSTSFQAKLSHVQYGTHDGNPAALLIFNFQFGFRSGSWKRITSASIKLTFEETAGPDLTLPNPRNPNNDPVVALIAPAQICGEVTTVQKTKKWNLSMPVQFQQFGLQAGPQIDTEHDSVFETDHRMWLTGMPTSEDTHDQDNSVRWDIEENSMQASGILHRFPGAVVITLPKSPEHHVRVTGLIRPYVAFSINPLRLKQKKDEPIYLDRKKTKGTAIMPGVDFNDKSFPWGDIVKIPTEYEVCA